jgi:hypothetical protein
VSTAPRHVRGVLWASLLLMAAGVACEEQRDLIAVARNVDACSDDACKPRLDAGPMQQPMDACVGDSCEQPRDACADANGCSPVVDVDADACADPGGCPSPMQCKSRVCSQTADHAAFCQSTAPAISLGDSCAGPDKNPSFRNALCIREGLVTKGELQVEGDVSVDAAAISFGADAHIAGALRYGGSMGPGVTDSSVTLDARGGVEHSDPNCAVDPALGFDLDSALKAAEASNDNASIGDALAKLANFVGDTSVSLPCGQYVAGGLEGDGKLTLHATGNVIVFVKGNVQLEKGFVIDATANARVTLIVSGSLNVRGGFTLGDPTADRHLLIAGNGKQLHFSPGTNVIGGSIYAPTIELLLDPSATLQVNGAVLVRNANINDKLQVRNAASATAAADSCGVSP